MEQEQAKPENREQGTRERRKIIIDVKGNEELFSKLEAQLRKCNEKSYGRNAVPQDIFSVLIDKITDKDIEKIRETTLRPSDRLKMAYEEFVKKSGNSLSYDDYLCKQLKLF